MLVLVVGSAVIQMVRGALLPGLLGSVRICCAWWCLKSYPASVGRFIVVQAHMILSLSVDALEACALLVFALALCCCIWAPARPHPTTLEQVSPAFALSEQVSPALPVSGQKTYVLWRGGPTARLAALRLRWRPE